MMFKLGSCPKWRGGLSLLLLALNFAYVRIAVGRCAASAVHPNLTYILGYAVASKAIASKPPSGIVPKDKSCIQACKSTSIPGKLLLIRSDESGNKTAS